MKIKIMLAVFWVMMITTTIFGQTTIKLFDPVNLTDRGSETTLYSFGTKVVNLSCSEGATATISGPEAENRNLIVDNFLSVNGTNICPVGASCFSGVNDNPYNYIGQPIGNVFLPIAPVDISSLLIPGVGQYI